MRQSKDKGPRVDAQEKPHGKHPSKHQRDGNMGDLQKPPAGFRRRSSTREKASRRYHASSESELSSATVTEKDSDIDGSSSCGESGDSTAKPRKTRRHDSSHSARPHDRKQRHRHRPKALPAPLEEDGKTSSERQRHMQVAIREDYTVQAVPRAQQRLRRSKSSAGEQVYDHRPLSHYSRSRYYEHRGAQRDGRAANDPKDGFFVGALLFITSLVICCGGIDEA